MSGDQLTLPGVPPVRILLRRSARSRRMSLRVSALDGRVTLSVPRFAAPGEARAFAAEKEGWIRRQLARQAAPVHPAPGGTLPFRGRDTPVRSGRVRAVALSDGAIWVPEHSADRAAALIRGFLRLQARDAFASACDRHAAALGRSYGRLSLRDTRSRWGSCSAEGNLMFSWRLIMAPDDVLDYVAAHEVAHLVEMNHAPEYWAVVKRIFPHYGPPRRWLRENGVSLHRVRFAD